MKTLALSTALRSLAEYASELDDEVVLLTKRNRPIAAIVPLRNVDRETLALSTPPGFLALIERSRRQVAGKTLSFAEMRATLKHRDRTSRSRRRRKARSA
jgi:antitoxin (DNA-binding transcriptional repressor) of toxin-antitoxin stability system